MLISSILRFVLAGVFGIAALGKLTDRHGTRKAVTEFGLPGSLAGLLSVLLPMVELVVATLLLLPISGSFGALGSLVLLGLFSLAICWNLAQGRKPDCHCFGKVHSAPIGWSTLVRNLILCAFAGIVLWQGRPEHPFVAFRLVGDLLQGHAMLGAFVVFVFLGFVIQVWLALHLLRQHGRILARIGDIEAALREAGLLQPSSHNQPTLPVGSAAPPFEGLTVSGQAISLQSLCEIGKPVLLVFSDPECSPCKALLPSIVRWQHDHIDRFTLALISRLSEDENLQKAEYAGLNTVVLQQNREIADRYYAAATPSALIVESNATIGSSLMVGPQGISQLVAIAAGVAGPSSNGANGHFTSVSLHSGGSIIGRPGPSFRLPDLEGILVDSAGLSGNATLLLFWNPSCGFCTSMLAELRALEATRSKASPQIIVVSRGPIEANRSMLLQSSVLLDHGFSVGATVGATGTPSAILMDSNWRIASTLAVGSKAVLALAAVDLDSSSNLPVAIGPDVEVSG